eukprot:TRINITY_DN105206_c0_g1_i1.p1 TRINITY_DN105206_c0_g1~~TRINITY_DN105206_c0_g1_i1.p1  ORF type:complete len:246 (-),score=34.93 TRINITY_DN105206_c0_g1_i1:283-1020(-)
MMPCISEHGPWPAATDVDEEVFVAQAHGKADAMQCCVPQHCSDAWKDIEAAAAAQVAVGPSLAMMKAKEYALRTKIAMVSAVLAAERSRELNMTSDRQVIASGGADVGGTPCRSEVGNAMQKNAKNRSPPVVHSSAESLIKAMQSTGNKMVELGNLPWTLSRAVLIEALDKNGFGKLYDFVELTQGSTSDTQCATIHLVTDEALAAFIRFWWRFQCYLYSKGGQTTSIVEGSPSTRLPVKTRPRR